MFALQLRAAVEAAPRERLSELSAALWKAFGAAAVTEAEACELSELIEARRLLGISGTVPDMAGRSGKFASPPRKPQRPPVRSVAWERRRRLAASGPMPPGLAQRFTTGELAVLRIVADEVAGRGSCSLCLDAIAARAGVSRSLAKSAIRQARRLGMVEVQERRRTGAKSLSNVITIIDREWLAWMKRGTRIGGRNPTTTDKSGFRERMGGSAVERIQDAWRTQAQRLKPRNADSRMRS